MNDRRANAAEGVAFFVLASAVVIIVAVLARGACLRAGFYLDDYNQQSLISGSLLPRRGIWDLHVAVRAGEAPALVRRGALPWWTDQNFVFAGLRPLASPLIWFEYRFLKHAQAMHWVSLALWCGLAGLVVLLYRTLLPARAALIAGAMFALSPVHCEPVAWVANQALLVSGIFGLLSLNAYARYRRGGSPIAWSLHAFSYCLALASGEYGLSALGYFLAHEAFVARGAGRGRMKALAFPIFASIAYLGLHVVSGYGVRGAGSYTNVFGGPFQLAASVARSIPSYVVAGMTGFPIAMGKGGFAGWTVAVVTLLLLVVRSSAMLEDGSDETRRRVTSDFLFWLSGGVAAAFPYGAVHYWPRLGVLPQIGFSGAAALVVDAAWRAAADPARRRDATFRYGAASAVALGAMHLPFALLRDVVESRSIVARYDAHNRRADGAAVDGAGELPPDRVFLMSALNVPIVQTMPLARLAMSRPFATWRVLSPAFGPHGIYRADERTLVLRTMTPGIFTNPSIEAYRSSEKGLEKGSEIVTDDFTVRVLEATDKGPSVMVFTFKEPLESPRYRFLLPTKEGFEAFPMPPEGGAPSLVPAAEPPAGLDVE